MGRAWIFSEKSVLLGAVIGGGRGLEIQKAAHQPTSWVSSRETGVSGKFGGRIKGAKYRFTLQDGTWDFPGDAIADRGLIYR